jgi:asparagine synthase (glutamine-hydrolysing)
MTERPFGCLLSGGLDSSLVCAIAKKLRPNLRFPVFTIAFKSGSTDLPFAKEVAKYLDLEHHIIEIDEADALKEMKQTIYAIESYDITTVRASIMQYVVAKYIKEKTSVKVLLVGENSDETFCGYKYFLNAPTADDAKIEAIRLVKDVHRFDGLRTDRTMSAHGLEVRLPFADEEYVDKVFSLKPEDVAPVNKIEKYTLRKAFDGFGYLPDKVLWRSKEALSDGISTTKRSWSQIIKEYVDTLVSDEEFSKNKDMYKFNTPITKESYYYRRIFTEYFGNSPSVSELIPYFWLPKWSGNVTDPSARVLSVYNEHDQKL